MGQDRRSHEGKAQSRQTRLSPDLDEVLHMLSALDAGDASAAPRPDPVRK